MDLVLPIPAQRYLYGSGVCHPIVIIFRGDYIISSQYLDNIDYKGLLSRVLIVTGLVNIDQRVPTQMADWPGQFKIHKLFAITLAWKIVIENRCNFE